MPSGQQQSACSADQLMGIVPVIRAAGRSRGAAAPRRASLLAPPWMQEFALPCAVACSALVGVPICMALGSIALFYGDSMGVAGNLVQQVAGAGAVSDAAASQLTGVVNLLRQDLQRQEEARQAWSSTLEGRLGRVESAVAGRPVSGGPPATQPAGSTAEGLGVDWAAVTAGAVIDGAFTSEGLGRDALGRATRALSILTGGMFHLINISQPPGVVLASDTSPLPLKFFSFRGDGHIAVQLAGAVVPTHVAVEQPPDWASVFPRAAPRHFEVRARLASEPEWGPYAHGIGPLEYQLAGPSAQLFSVSFPEPVQALQFRFAGNWGEEHTAVGRLRVFAPRT